MPVSVEMTPEDQDRLQKELAWFKRAEKEHQEYERAWDHQDVLYHGHKRFLREHASAATPRDRDGAMHEARKEFGAELHIPYTFSTIETIMPRTLSNRPKMLWLPRDRVAEQNVENVSIVCDAQQQKANYELSLQTTGRSGLKHGLGVRKTYWRLEEFDSFVMKEGADGRWVASPVKKKAWDDPDSDDVDIRDFYWDPYGDSMKTVRKVLHRSWRDTQYVLGKLKKPDEGDPAWDRYELTPEDVENGSGAAAYKKAWAGRRRAMGQAEAGDGDKDIHEVWEIHDRVEQTITTVLDRTWIVSVIDNPYWHRELPFHIYRPIEIEHRFVGVAVVDPIEDLQKELNWLRTDRRWNAMLKLHQAYAYNDGTVDPSQIKIGPGRLIPVNGDPAGLLQPLTVGDIPNSGYQEEAALRNDIMLGTGVDDTVSGADTGGAGAAATATGVQLVQAAAGLRIQAYTRRMELETIKPEASQWLALNQQRWTNNRDIRVPAMPTMQEPDRRWAWRTVGPAQMAGEFDADPEGGATAPDNVPQKRQDALMLLQALTPFAGQVNVPNLLKVILEKFDIPAPETLLAMPQQVPPETLDMLKQLLVEQAGMDPNGAQQLIATALQAALAARDQASEAQARGPQQEDRPGGQGGGPPEEQKAA